MAIMVDRVYKTHANGKEEILFPPYERDSSHSVTALKIWWGSEHTVLLPGESIRFVSEELK